MTNAQRRRERKAAQKAERFGMTAEQRHEREAQLQGAAFDRNVFTVGPDKRMHLTRRQRRGQEAMPIAGPTNVRVGA